MTGREVFEVRIIVATSETQGNRPGDFNYVPEGEIVMVGDCDCLHEGCDCSRSMVGILSKMGTTTMMVVESDLTRDDFRRQIREANSEFEELGVNGSVYEEQADALLDLAKEFPAGAVIERKGENFNQREISA
jgi:hypothetical protein